MKLAPEFFPPPLYHSTMATLYFTPAERQRADIPARRPFCLAVASKMKANSLSRSRDFVLSHRITRQREPPVSRKAAAFLFSPCLAHGEKYVLSIATRTRSSSRWRAVLGIFRPRFRLENLSLSMTSASSNAPLYRDNGSPISIEICSSSQAEKEESPACSPSLDFL